MLGGMENSTITLGAAAFAPAGSFCGGAHLANSQTDRLGAFRLRYACYIAEQRKPYPDANHDNQMLSDELDADGEIILVKEGGAVSGTVRANWFDSHATHFSYASTFELARFSAINPSEIAVCSRLAVSPEHRDARTRELLFNAIYERGAARNTKLCFVACATRLVRLFRRYGFREYQTPYEDAVVGRLHRLVLVMRDRAHLARCNSPFSRIASELDLPDESQPWLTNIIDSHRAIVR